MSGVTGIKKLERTALIRWIDETFDGYPYATNWLVLILMAPGLPLMLTDRHLIAAGAAILWIVPWGILVIWRFFVWLGRLERKWAKHRKR